MSQNPFFESFAEFNKLLPLGVLSPNISTEFEGWIRKNIASKSYASVQLLNS